MVLPSAVPDHRSYSSALIVDYAAALSPRTQSQYGEMRPFRRPRPATALRGSEHSSWIDLVRRRASLSEGPLRHFEGLADLRAQHDTWATEVAFQRHHGQVGARGDLERMPSGVDLRAGGSLRGWQEPHQAMGRLR
jgi:hypothetical protein